MSSGGSDAEALNHASIIINGLSWVQGHFSYILVQIVTHYSVNQRLPARLIYFSEFCGVNHFFIVFRMLGLKKLFYFF